jgi:hypothetical protein
MHSPDPYPGRPLSRPSCSTPYRSRLRPRSNSPGDGSQARSVTNVADRQKSLFHWTLWRQKWLGFAAGAEGRQPWGNSPHHFSPALTAFPPGRRSFSPDVLNPRVAVA